MSTCLLCYSEFEESPEDGLCPECVSFDVDAANEARRIEDYERASLSEQRADERRHDPPAPR